MNILAMGATGAIGGQLTSVLAARGDKTFVTTRRALPPTDSIEYIRGDARDDTFLRELLQRDWDVIVDFMVYDTPAFRRRIDDLLGATRQYVFTSTARVFADAGEPLTERSPRLLEASRDQAFLATDEYALTKARQEDLLRASGRDNWTIIRPYITFGEGRLQLGSLEKEAWLYRALKGRKIVFCDALMEKRTTMTDGFDVARMIATLVGNSSALGQDYNLAGDRATTWGEVLELYLEELEAHIGRRPGVVLQDLESFCRIVSSEPQIKYDRMYDRRFNPAKIGQVFDMTSLADCLPALRARLCSQLKHNEFLPIDWRAEALKDRVTAESAALGEISGGKAKLVYFGYRYFRGQMSRMVGRA